jgi:hypothetical protein
MYTELWEDQVDLIINAGLTHTSEELPMNNFQYVGMAIIASSIPASSTYRLQLAASKEKPTANNQWFTVDSGDFTSTTDRTFKEIITGFNWVRYQIVIGGGGNCIDFNGVIIRKGNK